jgi:hypothetical protein
VSLEHAARDARAPACSVAICRHAWSPARHLHLDLWDEWKKSQPFYAFYAVSANVHAHCGSFTCLCLIFLFEKNASGAGSQLVHEVWAHALRCKSV